MSERIQNRPKYHLEGLLLVAAPDWNNPLYGRSVCLVVHHGADRAVGLILNRSLNSESPALWKHLLGTDKSAAVHTPLHFAGPKSGPVVAIHDRPEFAEYSNSDGVYLAAQLDNLRQLVKSHDQGHVKVFLGQTEWSAGELEADFDAGLWLPLASNPQLVFAEDSEMWARGMRSIGDHFVASITKSPVVPPCPLMN
ncbi:MAG: YqgE/AlgH family protein [Planctomycetales bacterium]|nr:YqgE/AlgH family protein [Planctomycetales bacterium]